MLWRPLLIRIVRAFVLGWLVLAPGSHAADYYLGRSDLNPQADGPLLPGHIYDGSNADRVDEFFRKVPVHSSIFLGKFTFDTRGVWDVWLGDHRKGFRLKSGWTIAGAGTNSVGGTILRLVEVPVDKSGLYNNNSVLSTGGIGLYQPSRPATHRPNTNHVTIRDLQVDCNYPALAKIKGTTAMQLSGIQILGNHGLKIINVLVRNAVSKKLDHRGRQFECFQVYLYNPWAPDPPGDYFLDRVAITDYHGGYTSAICVNGKATGIIQNCTVELAPDGSQQYGINFAAGLQHFTITNNTVLNARRGINNDTGPVCTDITIISNRLMQCGNGMLLANIRQGRVIGNTLALDGTGGGILVRNHPLLENVKAGECLIEGNVLTGPGGEGITLAYKNEFTPADTMLYWSTNNIVQHNLLSLGLQSKIPPASVARNIIRPGNRRHAVNYPACPQVGQPSNLAAIGFPSDIGAGTSCTYSTAKAINTGYGHIAQVRLVGTSLDMRSDWGDGTGYTDFTTGYASGTGKSRFHRTYFVQWADVERGRSYRMHLEPGGYKHPLPATFRIYVDWNHDGRFDAPDELVLSEKSKREIHERFQVPRTAALGSTRMRIVMACGRSPGPDDVDLYWGEVEDYTLNVVP